MENEKLDTQCHNCPLTDANEQEALLYLADEAIAKKEAEAEWLHEQEIRDFEYSKFVSYEFNGIFAEEYQTRHQVQDGITYLVYDITPVGNFDAILMDGVMPEKPLPDGYILNDVWHFRLEKNGKIYDYSVYGLSKENYVRVVRENMQTKKGEK